MLANPLLRISTIYYLGHVLSKAIKNATNYIHTSYPKIMTRRPASSVFFLIRIFAIHTSKFFCHWEVQNEYIYVSEEKTLKIQAITWTTTKPRFEEKLSPFWGRWEINDRSELYHSEAKKKNQVNKWTQHMVPQATREFVWCFTESCV